MRESERESERERVRERERERESKRERGNGGGKIHKERWERGRKRWLRGKRKRQISKTEKDRNDRKRIAIAIERRKEEGAERTNTARVVEQGV